MNIGKISTIAQNVFWEVIRDRVLYIIVFFGVVMAATVRLIPELAASTERKIILDIGIATIGILGLVVTIFIGTGLVNKEIEKRTVYNLVAKPLKKSELIVGKHIGLSAVLAILITAMTIIYFIILHFSKISFPINSLIIAAFFLFVELSLLTAVGILFGVFTSSLLATLLTFAVYLMGNFSRDLLTLGKLTKNPGIEKLMTGLYVILPDLSRLDIKNQAVYGQVPDLVMSFTNLGYALLYMILLLSLATAIFARREF